MKHVQQKSEASAQPADEELTVPDLDAITAGTDTAPSSGTSSNVLKKVDDTSEGITANLKAS